MDEEKLENQTSAENPEIEAAEETVTETTAEVVAETVSPAAEADEAEAKPEKPGKKKKAWVILLIILGALILGLAIAGVSVFTYFYNKTNYEKPTESVEIDSSLLESLSIETIDESEIQSVQESTEETTEGETFETGVPGVSVVTPETNCRVYHLMLVGVDRRNASWNGNSDTMVLMSINYTKQTVTLTSFMRDSAAQIPGVGFTKLNHAFAVGGGPLLISTIRQNYGIPVDHYAWTDFNAMIQVIDILGGVDVTLTPKEAKVCGYGEIPAPQVCHLTGNQAVLHARDRASGGNDYGRTQRQRNVLMAIVNKAKSGSLGNLTAVANSILPYVSHNIDGGRMASLLVDMLSVVNFTFTEQRIPYDGLYNGTASGNLIPLYQQTVDRWWAHVYGD